MRKGVVAAVVAVLAATTFVAPGALADEGPQVRVDQPAYQHLASLRPGDSVTWRIGTWVEGARRASLDLQLRASGELVDHEDGLRIEVRSCEQGETRCERTLVPDAPLREVATRTSSGTWHVGDLAGPETTYLDVDLSLPAEAEGAEVDGLTGEVAVGLFASGDTPDDTPDDGGDRERDDDGELPLTGASVGSLVLLALVMTIVGAVTRRSARRSEP